MGAFLWLNGDPRESVHISLLWLSVLQSREFQVLFLIKERSMEIGVIAYSKRTPKIIIPQIALQFSVHKMFLFIIFHLIMLSLHSKGEEAGSESEVICQSQMVEPGAVSSNSETTVWVKTFFLRSSLSTVAGLVIGKSEALSVSSLEAVMENRTQLYIFS